MNLRPVTVQPARTWRVIVIIPALIALVTSAALSLWLAETGPAPAPCPEATASSEASPAATPAQSRLSKPFPSTQLADVCLSAVGASDEEVQRGARLVPSLRDGKPFGLKVFAIRDDSLFAALGLKNGDTVTQVNGHDLQDPAGVSFVAAGVLSEQLQGGRFLDISLVRKGRPVRVIALLHESC